MTTYKIGFTVKGDKHGFSYNFDVIPSLNDLDVLVKIAVNEYLDNLNLNRNYSDLVIIHT